MPRFHDESEAQAQARDEREAQTYASGYARQHNVHPGYVVSNPEGVSRGWYDNTGGSKKTSDAGGGSSYRPAQAPSADGAGSFLLVVLAIVLLGAVGHAFGAATDHFTPPSSPFPPQPNDPRSLATWTYAKQHATRYMTNAHFVPVADQSSRGDNVGGAGCIDVSGIMSGYSACADSDTASGRVGGRGFAGAFARFAVPVAPPSADDRILAPLVAVGGGDMVVEAGMASFRQGAFPYYKWMWDDFPAPASYCQAGCPRLQSGDDVFVSVYNLDGGRTSVVWENLTTGEYAYAYEPTPVRSSREAAVLLGTPEPPSTFWKFGDVSFTGATAYDVADDGSVRGMPLDAYGADRADARSPLGDCVAPIAAGAFDVRGDATCS